MSEFGVVESVCSVPLPVVQAGWKMLQDMRVCTPPSWVPLWVFLLLGKNRSWQSVCFHFSVVFNLCGKLLPWNVRACFYLETVKQVFVGRVQGAWVCLSLPFLPSAPYLFCSKQ